MDVIPAKAGISPLLKRPVTMSDGVFCFKSERPPPSEGGYY